ncbi:MAG: MFS transporter [Thermogutta sp.]|nr:MFS transporter [Thermogutta sp.]
MSSSLPESPRRDAYAAWRSPSFRSYAPARFAMVFASQIEVVALGVYVYDRTADPLALGWLGMARALPVILLALVGGHLADRFNRKLLVIVTLAVITLTSAAMWAAVRNGQVGSIYALLAVAAAAEALGTPARASLLPLIVPTADFSNAVAWNSSIFQLATMTGPVLGGLLMGAGKDAAAAILAVMGFRAAALGLMAFVRPRPQSHALSAAESSGSIWEGLRFVLRHRMILGAISLDLLAVLLGGVTYLLPVFAEDILRVGPTGLGMLRSAEAAGAIVMAMLLTHLPPMRRAGRNMLLAVTGFGVATIVFGLSKSYPLSLGMMFLIGAFDNISVVVRHTLVQMLTPDAMRGRVSAVNTVFIVVSNDLGGVESGVTARLFGPVGSVLFGGLGAILSVLAVMRFWPDLGRVGSLHLIAPVGENPIAAESNAGAAKSAAVHAELVAIDRDSPCS